VLETNVNHNGKIAIKHEAVWKLDFENEYID